MLGRISPNDRRQEHPTHSPRAGASEVRARQTTRRATATAGVGPADFFLILPLTQGFGIHRIDLSKAGLSMKRVCDLLHDKGRHVWSLTPDATVYEAIDQRAQQGVGALLVREDERLVRIVSELDDARYGVL